MSALQDSVKLDPQKLVGTPAVLLPDEPRKYKSLVVS